MNSQTKIIGLVMTGVTILALVIGGIFFAGTKSNTSAPGTDIDNPMVTSDPSPSATATNSKGEEVPLTQPSSPAEAQKEIDKARAFEDATEIEGFTKEEVQQTLKTATEYSYNTLTNNYYLSGEWDEAGMPNNLEPIVGRFFVNDLRKIISEIDTNPATGKDIGTKVFPLMFFVRPNGNIAPHEVCKLDYKGESKISCPLDGLTLTDMKYVPTMEDEIPGIRVTFSATAKIPVKIDGTKDAFTTVKYDYNLNFVRNVDFEETVNPNKFVISWYEVQVNMSAVEEIK